MQYMRCLVLLFICFPLLAVAQKRIERTYDAQGIEALVIDSDAIFQIRLKTSSNPTIKVITQIDGETFESTLLNTKVVQNRLEISTGRPPDFIPFNDKRSAHKVLSIELDVEAPDGLDLEIRSTLAAVSGTGIFDNVQINLRRGGCRLVRFRGSGTINTISGPIYIETKGVQVQAQSRNGNVVIAPLDGDAQQLELKSIHGDITVVRSQ